LADTDREPEEQSFSELTVELVERVAGLAGERLSAPIRAAGSHVSRLLVLAGAAVATLAVGLAFVGVAIGNAVGLARPEQRWWIYLLVAVCFLAVGAILAGLALRGGKSEAKTSGEEDGG
jgi:peptidoglycan/LPS O-acetylase OafA/YrhL